MIWQLVKRDPAWRNAINYAAVSAVLCLILPREFVGMFFGMVICMCCMASEAQQRATLFQVGLPIRACDLFLARILALLAGVWAPVASGAALLLLAGRPAKDAATLTAVGAALSVLVLVVQSSRVREIAGSEWAYIYIPITAGATWPISLFVPRAVVLAVCAAACPLLFWNIWRQLPLAFEVLPAKLSPQVALQGDAAEPAFVWWPILRAVFPPMVLLVLPSFVFLPFSGQWLLISIFCFIPVMGAVSNLPWTLALPIRRGALLAAALLPWLTLFLLGLLLSNCFAPKPAIWLERASQNRISDIRPPLEYWRTGNAPIVQSPWGESCRPRTVRLRLLGVAFYNPYSLSPANSPRFFEWQFRRATEAVYGEAMDYADYQRLRPRARPAIHGARMAILNLSACACWLMLLFSLAFTAMHWRFRRDFARGHIVVCWLVMPPMAGMLLIEWLPRVLLPGPVSGSLVNALLLRVAAWLPAGLPAVMLAAVLPVALFSWTAARLFRGVEIARPAAATRA